MQQISYVKVLDKLEEIDFLWKMHMMKFCCCSWWWVAEYGEKHEKEIYYLFELFNKMQISSGIYNEKKGKNRKCRGPNSPPSLHARP